MSRYVSGADALALAAVEAGVSLVTSYAGGPATAVVNGILAATDPGAVHVEWTSNEKVAIEMAYGGSVGGLRTLLCVKGVGLNVALDPLMTLNLCGCRGGMVILVGDDPGAWGSQNEQDSRAVARAAELPIVEPCTVADAYQALREAFSLSEELGLPVVIRFTRALAIDAGDIADAPHDVRVSPPLPFERRFMRWVALPINVVAAHHRLHHLLSAIEYRFERSELNAEHGAGPLGVIAGGFVAQKVIHLLRRVPSQLRILSLASVHPLPQHRIVAFARQCQSLLVLEETTPLLERGVRDLAQRHGLALPILGRDTGHVPREGELMDLQLARALNRFATLDIEARGPSERPMPSREALCEGCPYVPAFDALLGAIDGIGGRERAIVVGDPGCIARSQLEPYKLLDIKISLGSSIGIAAGVAISEQRRSDGDSAARVVALCGDSSFWHTGVGGLVDAAQVGAEMLVILLDNGTTALSGGQPHPGSASDARGRPRQRLDLAEQATLTGAGSVEVIDLDRGEDIAPALERGLRFPGVAVVVARGACPRHPQS